MIEPAETRHDRHDLTEALRELRRASGLSGERLAVRAHMSQSKISRIESGKVIPSIIDVERITQALDVPIEDARELMRLARSANSELVSNRRSKRRGLRHRQREIAAMEEHAARIRHALPVIPTGLLQTSDYLRQTSGGPHLQNDKDRELLVTHRLARQRVLDQPDKHFTFLLTEAAVRHMLLSPAAMAEQVDHLAALSLRDNVDIEVIPLDRQVSGIPLNVFVIYDDRLVTIETEAGAVVLRDPLDVAEHLDLFERFRQGALRGEECRDLLRRIADEFRSGSHEGDR